jgi:predicted flap endonuclease-1-like 5' DNA nuclease
MANSEFKQAPPLYGWAIAVAAGALMFGVSYLVIGIGANGAVAIGAVVALIIGVIFTIAEGGAKPAPGQAAAKVAPAPTAPAPTAPVAQAAPAAPAAAAAPTAPAVAPAPAATEAADAPAEAVKPEGLSAPIGQADDLKRISGVGPVLEGKLNALGFYHFWQIARWTRAEVDWVDGYLSFKGRIDRDDWIAQAKTLAETSPSQPPA